MDSRPQKDTSLTALVGAGYPPCSQCQQTPATMTASKEALVASGEARVCPKCGRPHR